MMTTECFTSLHFFPEYLSFRFITLVRIKLQINQIRNIAEDEQYSTKSLSNNVIKINCVTPEAYRTFIRYLKENNIYYHTYQLKEERAYRILIKHLRHSTDTEE